MIVSTAMKALPLLPTTVVGSYPQPDWLVNREVLTGRLPPRTQAREIWRVAEPMLEGAQDDATRLAIRDMERAGIDIVTDGEARRESYSNRFALALDGIDLDNPADIIGRTGKPTLVPRVTGPIRRRGPVEVRDAAFLAANTDRVTKITLPGPYTMSRQAKDEHYGDPEALAMAYAEAVNAEAHDLKRAGGGHHPARRALDGAVPRGWPPLRNQGDQPGTGGHRGHYDRPRLLRLRPRRARQA